MAKAAVRMVLAAYAARALVELSQHSLTLSLELGGKLVANHVEQLGLRLKLSLQLRLGESHVGVEGSLVVALEALGEEQRPFVCKEQSRLCRDKLYHRHHRLFVLPRGVNSGLNQRFLSKQIRGEQHVYGGIYRYR